MSHSFYAQNYYQNVNTSSSEFLRASLHDIIDDHNVVSYQSCKNHLKVTDEDPSNSDNIILVYKQNSIAKEDFASNGESDFWNREHVWAKSLGDFTSGPAYSDLHHLKPSDKTVNSSKGNKSFDNGGVQHDEATQCFSTPYTWEPPNHIKGDIARILFYMDVRYEGGHDDEPDLTIVEYVNTYPNPEIGKLSTLILWHLQDPVDDFELNRNEAIYGIQGNRNPFIDHPEYVSIIWENYYNCIDLSTITYNDSCNQQNSYALSLKGIMNFDIGNTQGKAIHLVAISDIPDLSVFGIGVANNGGGTDGQEETLPAVSVSEGDDILLARSPAAIEGYLGACYSKYDHVFTASSAVSQDGNDAIELFENGDLIETFGDVDTDGTGQVWEYTDSWAYKIDGNWTYGLNCEGFTSNLSGTGMFSFDYDLSMQGSMNVYYHIPDNIHSTTPILMVLHGGSRNADDYRNAFIDKANEYGVILIAPEFSDLDFPSGNAYNLGNMFTDGDNPSPETLNMENDWSYSIIDQLFYHVKQLTNNISDTYDVFGNSAGGQVAHRLLLFKPNSPMNKIVSSASGWYTMPDLSIEFPYGLASSPGENNNLTELFNKNFHVMVGSLDNDPSASGLRHTPEAELQGAHRLERATSFYNQSQLISQELGISSLWSFEIIEGVGHDHISMAPFASDWLYSDTQNNFSDCFYPFCTELEGCMDEEACNYNSMAVLDDGSCNYPELYYDCASNCINDVDADNICDEIEVFGCTDINALNFDSLATEDDNGCDYLLGNGTLNLQGIIDFDLPSGGYDGKAIHLVAETYIPDLSVFGIGVANNGGGTDGQEETLPQMSVLAGENILFARTPEAMSSYFGDCIVNFDYLIESGSAISQNGDDAIELFKNGELIETFGNVDIDGSEEVWEYTDSWAYKVNEDWTYGGVNCTDGSLNTENSSCPYPICNEVGPNFQNIYIPLGWSILSTYMNPENASVDEIFSPIIEHLIILKDYTGDAYIPQFSYNGIGDIQLGYGYSLKMALESEITIHGDYINPENNPLTIINGWSIIGYLRTISTPLDVIFESMQSSIIIVKDYMGNAYIPSFNFNGIGDMHPGQGYQIKTNSSAILQY